MKDGFIRVAALSPEYVYLFGVYMPFVRAGLARGGFPMERVFMNTTPTDPESTARAIRMHTREGALFAKASRGMHLDRILKILNEMKETENA